MAESALVKVIDFWQKVSREENLLPRQITENIDTKTPEVVDIVGPRRSGKSSVMKILIGKLSSLGGCFYMNFEDPYFLEHDSPQVIEELLEAYQEFFTCEVKYLFFDEIQNISSWEKAVRKLRDSGRYKIFCSGSSSKLLSSEFAILLTGRHLSYELLPLSFAEFLAFRGIDLADKKDLIVKETTLLKHFGDYLALGGFPAVVTTQNQELLKQYYTDMVERDIIKRHEVREGEALEKMGVYLLTNSAKTVSLASLKTTYELSFKSVSLYLDYFKEAFLIFDIPQFAYSLKTQQKAFKKIYAVDTGLANSISFRFSEDKGRILETCVFLELRRRGGEIYYYKTTGGREVDFYVRGGKSEKQLLQVAWDIEDSTTRKREVNTLLEAMEEQGLSEGLLLTNTTGETIQIGDRRILVKPVYKWLLGG